VGTTDECSKIHSFLDLAGYYRRFIEGFSALSNHSHKEECLI
jgi:hypothetical protein